MDKRYQVFVSSTYADLKDERSQVIQTIMEMDCIPAGMEIFPALDEEQLNFIKRVIDDCDYYIVIIGGRYGSLSEDGLSYTEKEFDYACEKKIKVIALVHENPDKIPVSKSDIDPDLREKLENFRNKVTTGRLVKFWNKAEDLPGLVALSLQKTIKTYPAIGWVRSNTVGNTEILSEVNELRKENNKLKEEIEQIEKNDSNPIFISEKELAGLDDTFSFKAGSGSASEEFKMTWGEIFYIISPYLLEHPADSNVKRYLAQRILEKFEKSTVYAIIKEDDFNTMKVHLSSLSLINVKYSKSTNGGMSLFWSLTEKGLKTMKELRSVKK
ncbi:DUF4062 domain-containing protein [Leeuwenhoekiella aequorea]|uniref:DUF4062 domain-containing protein n=1 Tax=Leeuwenhoekiella aequorea TaxID=283736 RepID=A0A4Q0P288_9FLAO|nr:DUF4062 domain-containing protein [Leeuwenhoekiella aequorea]RXG20663.1 putative protein DUF4062 [Leeuwenhoekiella aequorea]